MHTPANNGATAGDGAPVPFVDLGPTHAEARDDIAAAIAATIGMASVFGSRSSPVVTSRLISRPTTRKNSVIRPSLTKARSNVGFVCPA